MGRGLLPARQQRVVGGDRRQLDDGRRAAPCRAWREAGGELWGRAGSRRRGWRRGPWRARPRRRGRGRAPGARPWSRQARQAPVPRAAPPRPDGRRRAGTGRRGRRGSAAPAACGAGCGGRGGSRRRDRAPRLPRPGARPRGRVRRWLPPRKHSSRSSWIRTRSRCPIRREGTV